MRMQLSRTDPEASAAHAVLTQPPLLSLIVSFQRGVPSIAKPLLLCFIGDGLVYCTNTRVTLPGDDERVHLPYWYKTLPLYPRIVTPLYKSVRPHSLWLDHVLPQAIVQYEGTQSHRVLETWLRTSALLDHDEKPGRVCRQIVHRVSEAAASFGPVDLLQWLHDLQVSNSFMPAQQRRLVLLSAHYGNAGVLDWVQTACGRTTIASCAYEAAQEANLYNRVDVVRWLVERELVATSILSIHVAVDRNYVDLLRYLLQVKTIAPGEFQERHLTGNLYELAVGRGQCGILECLFEKQRPQHIRPLVLLAIKRGHLDIAKFLLNHRGESGPFLSDDFRRWIEGGRVGVLQMIASVVDSEALGCSVIHYTRLTSASHDIIHALLRMSSADDIIKTLVWAALYNREAAEFILATASESLPSDAASFTRRLMDGAARGHDTTNPSYYWWILEGPRLLDMKPRLWRANTREIRAIALYLIWQKPDGDELSALLEYDASRRQLARVFLDKKFAGLCVELCHTPQSRSCLQNYLQNQMERDCH